MSQADIQFPIDNLFIGDAKITGAGEHGYSVAITILSFSVIPPIPFAPHLENLNQTWQRGVGGQSTGLTRTPVQKYVLIVVWLYLIQVLRISKSTHDRQTDAERTCCLCLLGYNFGRAFI